MMAPLFLEVSELDGDLISHLPADSGLAWLHHGAGFVGHGVAREIDVGRGEDRFPRAQAALDSLFASIRSERSPVAFGSFTFDHAQEGSVLFVPRMLHHRGPTAAWTLGLDDGADSLRSRPGTPGRVRYLGSTVPDVGWLEAVENAVEILSGGSLDKVVLARDLLVWSEGPIDPRNVVPRLAAAFPGCFTFLCDGLVGATPELLVRRSGESVESLVLAGTVPRSADAGEDERLGKELLVSSKDEGEHRFAVESVLEVLAPLCSSLDVDEEPSLLRLANVQHLATSVRGRLSTEKSALELAGMLHPTAAVCGTPRRDALDLIRRLEGMDRGRYSGPVGWVNAEGDGEFGIALRCAQLAGTKARLFAGGGIVRDSIPEAELEETRYKLKAMQSALG